MQIGLESAIRVWVEEFSKISKAMTRYKVFAAIDPQWAAKYAASVKAGDATKINEFKEDIDLMTAIKKDCDKFNSVFKCDE